MGRRFKLSAVQIAEIMEMHHRRKALMREAKALRPDFIAERYEMSAEGIRKLIIRILRNAPVRR